MLSSNRRKGFTLTELLLVIAIISILAGLLLPALENARNSAVSLQCLTRMKNWSSAINKYGDDYDQVYPCAWWWYTTEERQVPAPANTPPNSQGWWKKNLVGAYVDAISEQQGTKLPNLDVLGVGCPAVPIITDNYPGYGLYTPEKVFGGSGYSQHYMDTGCIEVNKVKSLSEKVLMAETGHPYFIIYHGVYQMGGFRFYTTIGEFQVSDNHTTNFPNMPHNQGANYLFFDGHAKWYPGFPAYQSIPSEMAKICDAYEEWKDEGEGGLY